MKKAMYLPNIFVILSLSLVLTQTQVASASSAASHVTAPVQQATAGGPLTPVVTNLYLPLVQNNYGITAGFWKSTTGEEFYVTPDQANVDNFAVYVNVIGCGYYKITYLPTVPIVNNQFSFSGPFYASGIFDTITSAHGTDGLNSYSITGCGTVSGGPWNWTATWQDASQPPSIVTEGNIPPIIFVPAVPTLHRYHTITVEP